MKHTVVRICFLALFTILAVAQETTNSASVSGRVTDPSGLTVPDAQVTARQTDTNIARTATTGEDGRFRLPYLKVGPYEITVKKEGFAPSSRSLTLTVGSAFELPVALAIAAEQTEVLVSDEPTVLEAARSQIAGTVLQSEVRSLPLNGRNFLDLALLAPGVSPTNTRSTQLFPETSAVPGQGVSVSSQRNFSNSFIVDGLSANDDAAGLSSIFYGLDTVQEFQVVTSGGALLAGTSTSSPRAARTRSMATSTTTSAISASMPPTRCRTTSCRLLKCNTARASAARWFGTARSTSRTSSNAA